MKNNLTTTKSTDLVLKKSKSTLGITKRILLGSKSLSVEVDESWIKKLLEWADDNEISDLVCTQDGCDEYGVWDEEVCTGFPRDEDILLELSELDLRGNQLGELPKEIGNLTDLTWLDLARNQLTEVPKEIGNLTDLTSLNLRGNQLTEVPKEICDMFIQFLWLDSNNLSELPKEITNLTYVIILSLENNPNLILSIEQKEWIEKLISKKKHRITMDDDLLSRT